MVNQAPVSGKNVTVRARKSLAALNKAKKISEIVRLKDNNGVDVPVRYKDRVFEKYVWQDQDTLVSLRTGGTISIGIHNDYAFVALYKDAKQCHLQWHVLKAWSFLAKPSDDENGQPRDTVDHIDGNPLNNELSNLRHATKSEQRYNQTRVSEYKGGWRPIRLIYKSGKTVDYPSVKHAVEVVTPETCVSPLGSRLTQAIAACKLSKPLWNIMWSYVPAPPGEYKDIDAHPGYKISNTGILVRPSGEFTSGSIRAPYCYVGIRGKTYSIHALVAKAFVFNLNPDVNTMVNHIDGNKANNAADNLEWTDNTGNGRHAAITGLISSCKKVAATCMKTNSIQVFYSLNEASRQLNCDLARISECINGTCKSTAGYTFALVT